MTILPAATPNVIGRVDTDQDLHSAAVVNTDGDVLGTEFFSTTIAGLLVNDRG
jgi:hypothetical protein